VVLVAPRRKKFLGRPRREILDAPREIFRETVLGAVVLPPFKKQRQLVRTNRRADGHRVQVSLDFIRKREHRIGALTTMRDAESVRRIEDEMENFTAPSASGG